MKLDLMKLRIGGEDREFYVRAESSDAQVINQIFCDLDFDISKLTRFDDVEDFLRKARANGKRPLIIDGGANIGAASVYFSGQCQDALVVAIEPEHDAWIVGDEPAVLIEFDFEGSTVSRMGVPDAHRHVKDPPPEGA